MVVLAVECQRLSSVGVEYFFQCHCFQFRKSRRCETEGVGPLINAATSNSIYAPGATRNSEKRIVLLIVNLPFSEFLENGIGHLNVRLHFSDSVSWTLEKWVTTHVGQGVFYECFGNAQHFCDFCLYMLSNVKDWVKTDAWKCFVFWRSEEIQKGRLLRLKLGHQAKMLSTTT